MVRRRGVSERPHVPQHQGPRRRVRIEPGRLPIRGWVAKGAQGNEPLSIGRVLERTQGEGSRKRARGSPSRGKKSACLASGRLRGAARTGTLPEFWTPGLRTGHEHSRRRSRSGPSPAWPGSRCLSRLARQCPTHLCQGQSEDVGEILVVVAAFGLLPQDFGADPAN